MSDGVGLLALPGEPVQGEILHNLLIVKLGKFCGVTSENEELTGGLPVRDEAVLVLTLDNRSELEDPIC